MKRKICIIHEKVGVYTSTAFVHDFFAKNSKLRYYKRCDTSPIIVSALLHIEMADILFDSQVSHTSNVNYFIPFNNDGDDIKCLYLRVTKKLQTMAQLKELIEILYSLLLLPNKFMFSIFIRNHLQFQLMTISMRD